MVINDIFIIMLRALLCTIIIELIVGIILKIRNKKEIIAYLWLYLVELCNFVEFDTVEEWKKQCYRIGAKLHPLTIEQNAITSFKSRTTLVPCRANTIGPGLFLQADYIIGGCDGNLKGIAALVEGMKAEDIIARAEGIKCGMKATSCPDQLAQALKAAKAKI